VPIRAVISDFGGVLTTPLIQAFAAYQDHSGIAPEQLGQAMAAEAEKAPGNAHPLFELECGRLTEEQFLDILRENLEPILGHRPDLHRFSELYFEALKPNEPMITLMAALRDRGYRMALLTNNVKEWEPLWRPFLPVDEIFETVVDSGFVGIRKPDPAIYELTLSRLEGIEADECLFVDDIEVNCETARALGMSAVHFVDNSSAIAEIESALEAHRGSEV
jgi:putative hydrolase of the HAD superfamily